MRCRPIRPAGLPIRKSSDQSPVGGSPRPIAAPHVLHRYCLPRHPPYALTSNTHPYRNACRKDLAKKLWTTHHHTKNDHKTIDQIPNPKESETGLIKLHLTKQDKILLASTIQFSSHHARPRQTRISEPSTEGTNRTRKTRGWRSGSPKACLHHLQKAKQSSSIFSTPAGPNQGTSPAGPTPDAKQRPEFSVERR